MFDDDAGPNTGGMGAFAPSPLVDDAMQSRIMREIVDPVMAGLAAEGTPYCGFLYAGLMLTCAGPKVIEFNVRFGDPEAQVVVPMIEGGLAPRLGVSRRWRARSGAVHVRCEKARRRRRRVPGVSGVRPRRPADPRARRRCERRTACWCFTRGRGCESSAVVTAGGRVLTVVGRGDTYEEAIDTRLRGGLADRVRRDALSQGHRPESASCLTFQCLF